MHIKIGRGGVLVDEQEAVEVAAEEVVEDQEAAQAGLEVVGLEEGWAGLMM